MTFLAFSKMERGHCNIWPRFPFLFLLRSVIDLVEFLTQTIDRLRFEDSHSSSGMIWDFNLMAKCMYFKPLGFKNHYPLDNLRQWMMKLTFHIVGTWDKLFYCYCCFQRFGLTTNIDIMKFVSEEVGLHSEDEERCRTFCILEQMRREGGDGACQ